MKAMSGHFVLRNRKDYRDIAKIFPELLTTFLQETDQMPEDQEVLQMFIYVNQVELERNGKPEGYNRKGRMRLIFPLTRKEYYIRGTAPSSEVVRITEKLSKLLSRAGIDHEVEWNALSSVEE
jgi:hypothetical protein